MYWVYILECADNTYYTGSTPRLEERVKEHNGGKGAKYTRGRGPVILKQAWSVENRSQGLRLEAFLKKLPRQIKTELIMEPQLLAILAQKKGYDLPITVMKNGEINNNVINSSETNNSVTNNPVTNNEFKK